jgi:membrane associated rhomboid family serine protease
MTWAIIAVNIAIFVLVNLPLGTQPPDTADPAYQEYLQFLSQLVRSEAELAQATRQMSAYDLFVFEHGYRPAQPSVADLFLSMFLHGGFMHLFGNMLFLWIYGDNVEHRLGKIPFLVWYLLTGVAATMFHAVVFASSNTPLVGASGAISGVLGFYFIWFPKNVVRVLFFLPPFIFQVFEVPARLVLGAYLLVDNVLPFLFAGPGGVAHGAHIGGFIAGAGVAWVIGRRALARRAKVEPVPGERPSGRDVVREALQRGDLGEAAAAYLASPASAMRGTLSSTEAVTVAAWLRSQGRSDAALTVIDRALQERPRGPGRADLHGLAGSILLEDRGEAAPAYQHLVAALRAGPSPATEAAVRRDLTAIEAQQRWHPGRVRWP